MHVEDMEWFIFGAFFGTVRLFRKKIIKVFWVPTARAENLYACGYFITRADIDMTECYVKRLCSSLKKLITMYKNGQTINTITKTYNFKGFVCIPSSSTILFG